MQRRWIVVAVLAGLLAMAVPAAAQTAPVEFADSYSGFNLFNSCSANKAMPGDEPAADGKYPVFIYLHGWTGDYEKEWRIITQEAANQGFVAGAPRYTSFFSLTDQKSQDNHARCIFGPGTGSAVSRLCARPKADCSKGVVVSGLSLGANIAVRAANWSTLVRAAWTLGLWGPKVASVLPPPAGTRALPSNRLRSIIGQQDAPFNNFTTMNAISQTQCKTFDCLQPDGSGWFAVQNSMVLDGVADHCFHFYKGGCTGQQDPFDPGWAPPATNPWALRPAIAWLKTFTN